MFPPFAAVFPLGHVVHHALFETFNLVVNSPLGTLFVAIHAEMQRAARATSGPYLDLPYHDMPQRLRRLHEAQHITTCG